MSEKKCLSSVQKGIKEYLREERSLRKSKPENFLTQFVKSSRDWFQLLWVFFKKGNFLTLSNVFIKNSHFPDKNKMLYHFLDCMSEAYIAYAFPVEYSVLRSIILNRLHTELNFLICFSVLSIFCYSQIFE